MDKSIRAALDKYYGIKTPDKFKTQGIKASKALNIVIALLITGLLLIIGFKTNFLGLRDMYESAREIRIGQTTLGGVLDGAGEKIQKVFSFENVIDTPDEMSTQLPQSQTEETVEDS